ncbi:C39 family peptidase [Microlunatus speluncae]|uniref:C39 family peptidase n=1 Tax=Microlunatus speluncae TaxID=2594267 RepID=UPI001266685D|nr:C39 family peptidase [Microlunatus speluncae]
MTHQLTRRSLLIAGAGAGIGLTLGTTQASAAGVKYRYQKQPNGYYCSAASTRIAISAPILRRDSSENRQIPSQNSLAKGLNLHPYDGPGLENMGLKVPTLIATVLNNRLNLNGKAKRFRFRISPSGTLYADLQAKVRASIDAGYPVVINMNQVDDDHFDGHYIAIVGYGAERYQIADPYDPDRNGVWRSKQKIVDWNKLNRFTYFG